MNKNDSILIAEFLQLSGINSSAVLTSIGISEERIRKIKQGVDALHFAEKILLEIIKNNPQSLSFQTMTSNDSFSAIARGASIKQVDRQIEGLLQEMRQKYSKSNMSMDEFMNENNKKNARRDKVEKYFLTLCERDLFKKDAYKNYITSFWRAFEHEIPFKRSLFSISKLRSKY